MCKWCVGLHPCYAHERLNSSSADIPCSGCHPKFCHASLDAKLQGDHTADGSKCKQTPGAGYLQHSTCRQSQSVNRTCSSAGSHHSHSQHTEAVMQRARMLQAFRLLQRVPWPLSYAQVCHCQATQVARLQLGASAPVYVPENDRGDMQATQKIFLSLFMTYSAAQIPAMINENDRQPSVISMWIQTIFIVMLHSPMASCASSCAADMTQSFQEAPVVAEGSSCIEAWDGLLSVEAMQPSCCDPAGLTTTGIILR